MNENGDSIALMSTLYRTLQLLDSKTYQNSAIHIQSLPLSEFDGADGEELFDRWPVGGEFELKRRLGSEIGRNSAAAKRTDQARQR